MAERPVPVFRTFDKLLLSGTMAIYESQAELSELIPGQWQQFRALHPRLSSSTELYGASPCTSDRKIHYFTGVEQRNLEAAVHDEPLVLEAGEYAVVRVEDTALLRDTWAWMLGFWLPESGRREKSAPEFERYTSISESGRPIGLVEIWIPLEPLATPIEESCESLDRS